MIRIAVRATCVLPDAWRDDGYGGRELRPLRKSAAPGGVAIRSALDAPMSTGSVSFDVGAYLFTFREAATGLPILTVTGGALPMPYHMVVRGISDARQRAPAVASDFDAGRVPDEGVFRREDDGALRVRYTDRTAAQ